MNVYWIDLFCGAGGTSTGIEKANANAKVIACVNHDEVAIASHKANHPHCLHLTEDIRDLKVVAKLLNLVTKLRKEEPDCIIAIWASLECTNYSKAKGGLPRDADSRTLPLALYPYIEQLCPDYIYIENVREFMSWGDMEQVKRRTGNKTAWKCLKEIDGKTSTKAYWVDRPFKGNVAWYRKQNTFPWERPISIDKGRKYFKWCNTIQNFGYNFDYKFLNAADFGGYTSRTRYFGQFAKKGLPLAWPEPTHCKKSTKDPGLFEQEKQPWKPVREVLNLEDEGQSIFTRKIPLVEKSLERIYAGLVKFVANGDDTFIKRYNGGDPWDKARSASLPLGTISTNGRHAKVKAIFLKKYYSGRPKGKVIPVDGPAGTITCIDGHALVQSIFLSTYYSGSNGNHNVDGPAPTVTTKDRISKVEAEFLLQYHGKSQAQSTSKPLGTILTKDKFAKVQPQFLRHTYSGGGQTSGIDDPCPVITTVPKHNVTSCEFMDQQYGNSKPVHLDGPTGALTTNPKLNLVHAKPWLLDTNFSNVGSSIDQPARTIVAARKHHYLVNPQYDSRGRSVNDPCFTLIARMDKMPPYLASTEAGDLAIVVYEDDSPTMVKIKWFMAAYGIIDIKMRMLHIEELLRIQGFPEGYELKGTKQDQKKFIGNSVHPDVAEALVVSNFNALSKATAAVA